MLEFNLWNAAISFSYAASALVAMMLGLRILDGRAGRPWAETMKIIMGVSDGNSVGTAIYFGARWLGACLVVAAFVGG